MIEKLKRSKVGNWFVKNWSDPVWSKVFANSIWVGVALLGTLIWFLVQMLWFAIPFKDSWHSLLSFLNQDIILKQKHILYNILLIVILIVNPKLIWYIFRAFLSTLGPPSNKFKDTYHFMNQGHRNTDTQNSQIAYNTFQIKPVNNTHAWQMSIYFSDDYSKISSKDFSDMERLLIYKNANDSSLYVRGFDNSNDPILSEYKMLFDKYIDQEFEIGFHHERGTIMIIQRHGEKLFKSSTKSGNHFRIVTIDTGYDFDLEIKHNRVDIFPDSVWKKYTN